MGSARARGSRPGRLDLERRCILGYADASYLHQKTELVGSDLARTDDRGARLYYDYPGGVAPIRI